MDPTWKMLYYQDGDETQIIELFRMVFEKEMGKTESELHWNWENKQNVSGHGEILLAKDGDRIVGQYAVIPVTFQVKGERVPGTLSLDTMVHPDYRGQRMFTLLANKLYDDLGKKGIPITYGFPNGNSAHGFFNKLQWEEIADPPMMVKTIETEKIIAKATKSRMAGKIGSLIIGGKRVSLAPATSAKEWTIAPIKRFSRDFNTVFEEGSKNYNILLARDSVFLNWRFVDRPESEYQCYSITPEGQDKPYGYIVLAKEDKMDIISGFLVDYFSCGNRPDLDKALIAYGSDLLNYQGVDAIVALMFDHSPYYSIIKKQGFMKVPRKRFPKDIYFGGRKNNDDIDFDMVKDKSSWYLTWGDTDVI